MSLPENLLVTTYQPANIWSHITRNSPPSTLGSVIFRAMSSSVGGEKMWANGCGSGAVFVPSILSVWWEDRDGKHNPQEIHQKVMRVARAS